MIIGKEVMFLAEIEYENTDGRPTEERKLFSTDEKARAWIKAERATCNCLHKLNKNKDELSIPYFDYKITPLIVDDGMV